MSGRQREPMSRVDTAWLRMERPTNLMMITGVLTFAARLDPKQIRKLLAERVLAFRRFGQIAVQSASGAWWETDREFDIDRHVRVVALPGAAGKAELENFVSELGVIGDGRRVRDPDAIVQRFGAEFEKLLLIVLMEDWEAELGAPDAAAMIAHELGVASRVSKIGA